MESDLSSSADNSKDSKDSCVLRKEEKRSLKLQLTRVFSSNSLRSPKSPSGSCDSQRSSSNLSVSPIVKSRYSWNIHSRKKKGSNEGRFSLFSSTESTTKETFSDSPETSPNSSKNSYSPIWDSNTG